MHGWTLDDYVKLCIVLAVLHDVPRLGIINIDHVLVIIPEE